jgi:hypothetical protein
MNWKEILTQMPSIRNPISLAALVVMVLYGIYKLVLSLPVFAEIGGERTFQLLDRVIFYIFILALTAVILSISRSLILAWINAPKNNTYNIGGSAVSVQQFVNPSLSLEQQVQFFLNDIGLAKTRAMEFATSKDKAYVDVWKSLQALRLAGDDLWNTANEENLLTFAKQLRKTTKLVREGEIYFDDEDREKLLGVLTRFGQYRLGKVRVVELRTKSDLRDIKPHHLDQVIEEQVNKNRAFKSTYEDLLEKIRVSFKRRLSN